MNEAKTNKPTTIGGLFSGALSASEVLKKTALTMDERGKDRGLEGGERSMAHAIDIYNAITGSEMTEQDGYVFMRALKEARFQAGTPKADDLVDMIGYTALQLEDAYATGIVPPENLGAHTLKLPEDFYGHKHLDESIARYNPQISGSPGPAYRDMNPTPAPDNLAIKGVNHDPS